MAKCKQCGKENESGTKFCIGCGGRLETDSSSINLSLLSENNNESSKNIDDCLKTTTVTKQLSSLAYTIERVGKVLFILIILAGLVISYDVATAETISVNSKGVAVSSHSFKGLVFAGSFFVYLIYASIEYYAYKIITALLSSLASIVHNTGVSARITEYMARNNNES